MLEQMTVVSLSLTPALAHKLDKECSEAVKTQKILGAVMFLNGKKTFIRAALYKNIYREFTGKCCYSWMKVQNFENPEL